MSGVELLVLLVIAGACGAAGQGLAGYSRGGCLGSIVVGFLGALIGMSIARALALPTLFAVAVGGTVFPIVWSVVGAALFVAALGLITRRTRE